MKYVFGLLWLAGALAAVRFPGGRRWFAYLGTIMASVHAGALACGWIYQRLFASPSIEGGVSLTGFVAGIAVGLALGIWLGRPVGANLVFYWPVQLAAAACLMLLPLFPI